MKTHAVVLLALLFSLTACQTRDEDTTESEPGFVPVSRQASRVNLIDLALNPESYEDAYVETEGAYHRLPRLFCSHDPHPSPATWRLATDSFDIPAGGFDSQLSALLPEGLKIAVAGRWQKWQGPVGCGKRASDKAIWYLDVDEILSPSPIAQVTLTPAGSDGLTVATKPTPAETLIAAGLATVSPESTRSDAPAPGEPTHTPTSTLAAASERLTPTTTAEGIALTPQTTSTPTVDSSGTESTTRTTTPTPTTTIDPDQTATSPTTTASPTPTATSGNAPLATHTRTPVATRQPLATATPIVSTLVDQGVFEPEELVTGFLNANEQHGWGFEIGPSELITVSVAAAPSLDIVLSVTDAAGNQIWEQNRSPANAIEQINRLPLEQAGDYELRLRAAGNATGSYVIMMLHKNSYRFVSQGIITYGDERALALEDESDHFWYFHGSADDSVTITAEPNDNGDLFLEIYGTDGANLGDFIDEGAGGEPESINLVLPDTGMYSIRLGEYEFLPSDYTIKLERG